MGTLTLHEQTLAWTSCTYSLHECTLTWTNWMGTHIALDAWCLHAHLSPTLPRIIAVTFELY